MEQTETIKPKYKYGNKPAYTKGEEIFNMTTHIVGSAFGILVLVMCLAVSVSNGTKNGVAGSIIFGLAVIIQYTVSAVYHGLTHEKAKKVLRIIDHCTIYGLIAGTYTPILICAVAAKNPAAGYTYLAVEWGLAILATTLTAVNMKKYTVFSMICYIALGWGAAFFAPLFIKSATLSGFLLIMAGGVAYTVGAVLYGIGKKKKYMHSVFHIMCLLGTVPHFLAVILYCL